MDNCYDIISYFQKIDDLLSRLFEDKEFEQLFLAKFLCNGSAECASNWELLNCYYNSESFSYVVLNNNGSHLANSNPILHVLEFVFFHLEKDK